MFETPSDSFVQLFSVLNGDVIYLTFKSLWRSDPILSWVYLVSFIIIFMYLGKKRVVYIVNENKSQSESESKTNCCK